MRLKYHILWFEDQEGVVEGISPKIKDFLLDDLGFELECNIQRNGNDLESLVKGNDFDLIVTDLNLDDGETGKNLIERIRNDEILTEVLLYSSNGEEIQKIIQDTPGLERVSFAAGHEALPDRLKRIIALTVKKVQDVNNLRGLVIAEAIDLEDKMLDIITQYFSASGDEEKISFIDKHKQAINDRFSKNISEISVFSATDILAFIDRTCSEMSAKYDALHSLLNSTKLKLSGLSPVDNKKIKTINILKTELGKMKDEVIDLRNDLAHVKEEKDTSGNSILKNKKRNGSPERIFDNKAYVEIRKSLRRHADNLVEIAKHF